MQNIRVLAPKAEEFLKQTLTCPIAVMCFKENSESEECLPQCAEKEAAGYAGLQLTLLSSFTSSKKGAKFHYS